MIYFRVLVLLLALPLFTSADELRTLSGKSITGMLTTITDTEITLKTDGGAVATPLAQALLLDLRPGRSLPSGTKYYDVRLLDDTSLFCEKVAFAGKDVELTLLSGTKLKLPLNYVVSVLKDANDAGIRKQFEGLAKGKVRRDRILLFVKGTLNALEGTLGDVDAQGKTIQFKRDTGDILPARFEVLQGLIFYRTEVPTETPICRVIDQDGNTLAAAKLNFANGVLNVTTTFGGTIPLKAETLSRLDFNLGRLTYLSDLQPAKLDQPATFGGFLTFHKDANQDNRPIILQEKTFAKGLSMEGGVKVDYNLAGKYKEFKAVVGMDTRNSEVRPGKTRLTIYCDGDKRFSEEINPREVRPVALNVKDVGTLRIVVEGPHFDGYTAFVTLADARVTQ